MKISPQTLFVISSVFIFLISGFIWYLILYQAVSFFNGLIILSFLIFLAFWQNFLAFRRTGELIGLKSKKQIFIVSIVFALCFGELIWSISFMPFSFFILSGILAVIFGSTLDIFREYFNYNFYFHKPMASFKGILRSVIVLASILLIGFLGLWFLSGSEINVKNQNNLPAKT